MDNDVHILMTHNKYMCLWIYNYNNFDWADKKDQVHTHKIHLAIIRVNTLTSKTCILNIKHVFSVHLKSFLIKWTEN